MAPVTLTLIPNFGGSGDSTLTFKGDDGVWYTISPESESDVKELLSAVHVVHHNFD